jgi:hypothetical protein
MSITKQIRKKLIETKEQKEKSLIEESLVKERLLMIVGNKNFDELNEQQQLKMSFLLLKELSYLNNNGLINEGFGDLLSKLFGGFGESLIEKAVNSILGALGFPDGFFKRVIVSAIATKPSELFAAFNDCRALTKVLARSLAEASFTTLQKEKGFGGTGYDTLRNALGGMLEDTKFIQKLEEGLEDTVCSLYNKFFGKAQDLASKVQPKSQPVPAH